MTNELRSITWLGCCSQDKKLEGHTGKILSLHWLADELLVSSADDDTVRIWDVTTGQCLHTIDNVAPCLGVISTGYHVLTIDADSLPLDVQLWDALSGRCLRTSSLSGPVNAIDEFDTKATNMLDRLESGGADSVADECTSIACHLIVPRRAFAPGDDPTPFRPPAVVMTADKPQRVVQKKGKHASFCEQHRPAAVSRGTSGKLALSRSATSRNLLSTLVEAAPVVTSGDDAQDQAAEEYGYLMDSDCGVGDAALGIVAKTKSPVTAEATAGTDADAEAEAEADAAGATIDDWLIVGGEDCLLRVMDIATGRIVRVLEGHYQTITSLALVASDIDATKKRRFSHLVVLSASVDMTIRAWDVLRGTTLATLSGHHSSIRCLSILPPESLPEDSRSSSPLDTKTAKGSFGGATKWDDDGNKIEAYVVSGSEGGSLRLWALRRTVKPRTSSSFTAYRVSNNFYDPSNYTDDDDSDDDNDNSSRDSSHDGGYHHYDNPFAEPPLPRHLTKEERRRYGKCECLASIDNGHVESITCLHTVAVHSSSTTVAAAVAASVAPASLQALSRSQASLTSLLNAPTSSGSSLTGGVQAAPTTQHHSVSVISGSEDTTLRVWSVRTMLAEYDYEYCLLLQGHRAKINFTLPVTLPPPQSLFGSLTASSKTVIGGESPRPLLSSDAGLPSTFPVETSGSAKTASRLLTATSSSFYFHQQQQPLQPQCQYLHPHPSAALAPSGLLAGQQVILSGSDDGTMVLWDVHSGDALHTLHGHIDSVQCALVLDQIEYSPATTALLNDHSEASTTDIDAPAATATSAAVELEPHRHHVLVSGGSRGVLYTWAWS